MGSTVPWIAVAILAATVLFLWSHIRYLNRRLLNFANYTGAILLAPQVRDRQTEAFREMIRVAEGGAVAVSSQVLFALGHIADQMGNAPNSTFLLDVHAMIWREKQQPA